VRGGGTGRRGGRRGAARRAAAGRQRAVALPVGVGASASYTLLAVFSEVYLLNAARGCKPVVSSKIVTLENTIHGVNWVVLIKNMS